MNGKVRKSIMDNLGYGIIALASLAYMATAFVTITQTGKTVFQIIADGFMTFMFGFSFNKLFELQGMKDGEREDKVQRTISLHGEIVMAISPYIEALDIWCEIKNRENFRLQRTRILSRVGMKYEEWFDSDGTARLYEPDTKRLQNKILRNTEKKRMAAYNKAVNIKLTELVSFDLTGNGIHHEDTYYLGRNKLEYEKQVSRQQSVSSLITAVIFGYYGVKLISDFTWAALVWTALQVALFLVLGVVKMYRAYNYITDEYRSGIVRKIDLLQKYQCWMRKTHLEEIPQEHEKEVEQTKESEDSENGNNKLGTKAESDISDNAKHNS